MAFINGHNVTFGMFGGNIVDLNKIVFQHRPITEVYGWHVDPSISDPAQAITYLEDAVGMTPAGVSGAAFSYGSWENAFFMPKPCMLRYDGTVAYYLDPNDYTKKEDGTASDVANPSFEGNAMMEWPLIWYKFEAGEAEGEGYFYCSDKQVDSSYKCWCNYDSHNNIIPHFYTAIYNVTGTSKVRSLSGIALTPANGNGGTTASNERDRAVANNTTSAIEWYTEVFADRMLISALLILISKSLDNQSAFGRGIDTGGQAAKESYVTGTLNNKGLFWGDTATGSNAVKVFGMENWWGCLMHRVAGLVGGSDGSYKYKLTCNTADGSIAVGYNPVGDYYLTTAAFMPDSHGYPTKMSFGEYGMLPKTLGGSSTTFYSVYFYTGTECALFGDNPNAGLIAGSLSMNLMTSQNTTSTYIEGSLSCKPVKQV